MTLYEIMVNRPSIWILKELYDNEAGSKKSYTMKASQVKKYLKIDNPAPYLTMLERNGLLHVDVVKDDMVIALTQKGKDFFKGFDKLKLLIESQVKVIESKPRAVIEYDLTNPEKEALFNIYKVTQLAGNVPVKSIIVGKNSKAYEKLEQLNLVAKIKKGKTFTISLTPTGKKVLQKEISEKLK